MLGAAGRSSDAVERTGRHGDSPATPASHVQREAHGSFLHIADDSSSGCRADPVDPRHGPLTKWRNSSCSIVNGDCVEVAGLPASEVRVRDSKAGKGPVFRYTPKEFTSFLPGANKDEFDVIKEFG